MGLVRMHRSPGCSVVIYLKTAMEWPSWVLNGGLLTSRSSILLARPGSGWESPSPFGSFLPWEWHLLGSLPLSAPWLMCGWKAPCLLSFLNFLCDGRIKNSLVSGSPHPPVSPTNMKECRQPLSLLICLQWNNPEGGFRGFLETEMLPALWPRPEGKLSWNTAQIFDVAWTE